MTKIIGNTTATPNPRPDWNQTDSTKADYIENKPEIVDNLDSDSSEDVLSAAQGKVLKQLIEENPYEGITHYWDGTVLTVTSASGTSSADLKGEDGYSPEITVDQLANGARIGVTDEDGITQVVTIYNGKDGVSPHVEEIADMEGRTGVSVGGVDILSGLDGADGKSAFEIAVDNGYDGAEVEWLASLQGNTSYAETVDDMTDTNRVYLGANGNIWAYTEGIIENKVNQYNPDTAQFNVRYNNGAMSTTRGFALVEVDGLDFADKSEYIVRFSGETLIRHTNLGVYGQVAFFAGSELSSTKWIYSSANSNSIAFTQDDAGYYVDLMDAAPDTNVTRCYFAICLADNTAISAADCENLFIEFVPLTTYTSEYSWHDTGIAYANYVLTDNDTTIIAKKVDEKINAVVYVDCETGDNSNTGSQDSPLKTIQKAIDSGAKTIYCKAGTYYENITLSNAHGVKIIGQWETYESGSRPKVRIDHSVTLEPVDNGDGLKTIDLPSDLYKNQYPLLYNVFVTKNYQPTAGSGINIAYTVSMWNVTNDQISEHYKLVPVMTLEECQNTEETFFYDGTTLYIHSTCSTFKMVSTYKRNKVENCSDIVFEDIAFDYSYYDALTVNNSNDIILRNCEFSHSSTLNGLATVNMNGELYNCEAYQNRNDGFNFHDFGETTIYNCIGAYNYDDGISHHDGCTGSIHGGQYHHNGKGGVSSPTYGAVIDIYNAVMHNNQYGIYAVGDPADRQIVVSGCYIHHNTYGIASPKYELLVIHSTIADNSTNTSGNVTVV